jgi:hypothetical protein
VNDHQHTPDPSEFFKLRYERVTGEPWSELEKRVRSDPDNRWLFEMLDQQEWDEIEAIRLARRPWWKKLMGIKQ